MNYKASVDADVIIKLSVVDCFGECIEALGVSAHECATLRSMTFSAGLSKPHVRERKAGPGAPAARLHALLRNIPKIDNISRQEERLAAAFVTASQARGLAVDAGEAILMAVSISRQIPYLMTGDKRAIRSLPALEKDVGDLAFLRGRIVPLELALLGAVRKSGLPGLQRRLSAGQSCDVVLARTLSVAAGNQKVFEATLEEEVQRLRRSALGYIAKLD